MRGLLEIDLRKALDLCRSPGCAGHPVECDSCRSIAEAIAAERRRCLNIARRATRVNLNGQDVRDQIADAIKAGE